MTEDRRLEFQLQRSLSDARRNEAYAGDLAEATGAYCVAWNSEVGMVEGIEHLPAKLQANCLSQAKVFRYPHVSRVDRWSDK